MTWLISDANIIIDMKVGNILEKMFSLPETFATPNVLYAEELAHHHSELPLLGLVVLDVNEEFMNEAYRLGGIYRKPGFNDLLALALAKQESCPLLTGDMRLREAANSENVELRGTLWVVEKLVEHEIIDYNEAEVAYEKMREDDRRLPWQKVEQQINNWKNN